MKTTRIRTETREIGFDTAFRLFTQKGYVVFENVIPPELVAELRETWESYFQPFRATKPDRNRLLMHIPFVGPLAHPMVIENPRVMAIADRVLGRNFICGYFGSETPLPGADYMETHFDLAFFNRMKFLNPPLQFLNNLLGSLGYTYGLQMSIPLVDSGPENAPFEIWPATNRLSLKRAPSEVVSMPAGSIMVRDIRNLHRGTPHRGTAARPFISVVYMRPWVPRWRLPEIPSEVYSQLSEKARGLFRLAAIGQQVPSPEAWAVRSRN